MSAKKGNQNALGNKGGRPSTYNFELCEEICKGVANGMNIKTVLASNIKYPEFPTWCKWKRENDELFNLYIRSIQDKAESVDQEIDFIMDDTKKGKLDPPTARVLIDTLKWKAAKYYPKMFGDKLDMTTNGKDLPATSVIDYSKLSSSTLKELEQAIENNEQKD